MSKKEKIKKPKEPSLQERDQAYKDTYRRTRDHRAAVRSYASGNKWATENAKNTGNW